MEFIKSEKVEELIASYPKEASQKLAQLRQLVIDTAKEEEIAKLLETTKWGEPSYVAKGGSTIRMDWKEKQPDKFFMYFVCSTDLVSTFKLIFGDELTLEGNRAVELNLRDPLPEKALKRCISLALNYHKLKHLPMLGV